MDKIIGWTRSRKADTEPFIYTAVYNPLVANTAITVQVNIHADSDFLIEKTTLSAYSAAGVVLPVPDMLLALFDTGSGRALQDAPVHVGNCTGTAQLPFIWTEPKILKGGGTLAVVLLDLGGVNARVDISFIGQKIYYLSGYSRQAI